MALITHTGNIWPAFLLHEGAVLLHGVTEGRVARKGFARTVIAVLDSDTVGFAHYGQRPGEIIGLGKGVFAGVTQREYDAELLPAHEEQAP